MDYFRMRDSGIYGKNVAARSLITGSLTFACRTSSAIAVKSSPEIIVPSASWECGVSALSGSAFPSTHATIETDSL